MNIDVLILGAGAAGLMCAIEAAKRHRKVLVLDHANKPGKKILMSGGGRCNFTNYHISPENYISHNQHFFKSALSQYTQLDFLELVKTHHIPYHEKKHGQLFCDHSSKDILNMLLAECAQGGACIQLNEMVERIEHVNDHHFELKTNLDQYRCQSLVIATGGLSIPTMGASPFGYKVAAQFGIKVWPTRAGLVPFTLQPKDKEHLQTLAGISNESLVCVQKKCFRENILFTHRGLSGPALLQLSNYWQPGEEIIINLLPEGDLLEMLKCAQRQHSKLTLKEFLSGFLAKRVVSTLLNSTIVEKLLASISHAEFELRVA